LKTLDMSPYNIIDLILIKKFI